MPDLIYRHCDLFVVIVGMGIIKKPEMHSVAVAKPDIVAMDGTRIGSGIDFRINIEKFQAGKGNKLVTANS